MKGIKSKTINLRQILPRKSLNYTSTQSLLSDSLKMLKQLTTANMVSDQDPLQVTCYHTFPFGPTHWKFTQRREIWFWAIVIWITS